MNGRVVFVYNKLFPILPLVHRKIDTGGVLEEFEVLTLNGIELFGSKIKALLDCAAPRDLYDGDNMIRFGVFNGNKERELLKKCAIFYMVVGNKEIPDDIHVEPIDQITWYAGAEFDRLFY